MAQTQIPTTVLPAQEAERHPPQPGRGDRGCFALLSRQDGGGGLGLRHRVLLVQQGGLVAAGETRRYAAARAPTMETFSATRLPPR